MNIIIVHTKETEAGFCYSGRYVINGTIEDVPDFIDYLNSLINERGAKAELDFVETTFLLEAWKDWRNYR